jgi:PadR family transcriptional regulator, regulatory protein PadR
MSYNIGHMTSLGDFEQILLLAILRLEQDGAYGVSIRDEIVARTKRNPTPGAIYTTLERLQGKGLVKSETGEATAERGGRAKRYYTVTGQGRKALQQVQADYRSLSQGLVLSLGGIHA